VEALFAELKNQIGLRRLRLRGLTASTTLSINPFSTPTPVYDNDRLDDGLHATTAELRLRRSHRLATVPTWKDARELSGV
jgi:hypothetical protein